MKTYQIYDSYEWITVHPHGKENKGQPVKLDEETGEVLGGLGGKFNGKHISAVPEHGKNEQVGAQAAIEHKKATGKHQGSATPPAKPISHSVHGIGSSLPAKARGMGSGTLNDALDDAEYKTYCGLGEHATTDFKNVWTKYESQFGVSTTTENSRQHFHPVLMKVAVNGDEIKNGIKGFSAAGQTLGHELGHNLDCLAGKKASGRIVPFYFSSMWNNGQFADTIHAEVKAMRRARRDELIEEFARIGYDEFLQKYRDASTAGASRAFKYAIWRKEACGDAFKIDLRIASDILGEELRQAAGNDGAVWSALSDIVEGGSKGFMDMGAGHGKEYWSNIVPGRRVPVALETFANLCGAMLANKPAYDLIKKTLPKTVADFEQMLKDIP